MSQSQSFGNFPKRKFVKSPRKSYFSPRSKNKNQYRRKSTGTPNSEVKRTILHYYSPTSETKRVRLTPDDENDVESHNISTTSIGISVRKDLFDSKLDNDASNKDIITISDDDEDDISNFDLHFDRRNKKECSKKLLKDVKVENISSSVKCGNNSKDELHSEDTQKLLDKTENVKPKFKLSSFTVITDDEVPKKQLNQEKLENKSDTLNDEFENLQEVPEPKLDKNTEVIIYSSPKKSPKKTPNQNSPNKSVESVEDVVSLVEDIDWWDDDNHQVSTTSKQTTVVAKKTSDCNESTSKNVDPIIHNNTSHNSNNNNADDIKNVNGESNGKTMETSSADDKIDKISNNSPDFMLDCDLLYYIVTTPPACIAWSTIFVHSKHQNIYKKYLSLPKEEKLLYSRLFQRKYDWIRLDNMKYNAFITNINMSINLLTSLGFIKYFNAETEDLSVALNLMRLDEVKKASDILKLNKKGNKTDMIDAILKEIKNQPHLNFGNTMPVNRIKMKLAAFLPELIKLEDEPRNLFMSFLLISTYAQTKSKDDNRIHIVVDLLFRLRNKSLKDLGVPLTPIPIFKSLASFEEYEKSVNLVDQLIEAKKEKKWNEAKELIINAKTELVLFLGNAQNIIELNEMPEYFRKFTSGANYVYALSEGIEVLKKFRTDVCVVETIGCIKVLIEQNYFQKGKRPHWTCELALLLERSKNYNELFMVLRNALKDDLLTPLGKFVLAQRCEMLIKKKRGLSPSQRSDLALLSEIEPFRYSTNSIQAKAMPNVSTNKKQMWSIETNNGRQYTGVEEIVRQHYMSSEGGSFSDGCHDEGRIIITLALCAFWDIIYYPIEGMFHVRLQSKPLDWGSSAFYWNRADLIKEHIKQFRIGGISKLMDVITNVCSKYYGTLSLLSWELIQAERLPDIKIFLECLGVEPFLNFCDYLLQGYKERSSGLPDLTLWNVNTSKCLFVEVKGPTDKLSPKQIIWLKKFNEFGIDAEVCHVHTLHTGKRDIVTSKTE
ncbi:hypothetical protein O3M35_011653 [Rhynocoris fuscipes]|uniref:Fanconi-associated nuclease n=1 Tax=Rhynocoris fuscipes TaxID=488301 RepID=A0AAW1D1K2_9HEMI